MPELDAGCRLDDSRWCLVYCQPHREARAKSHLENQKFRVFLPVVRKTVRHARQFRSALAPLFPRYLFVRIDLKRDRWSRIQSTAGVSHLVMDGDRPRRVPEWVVEELSAMADSSGLISFEDTLLPGQRVTLLTGPFAGLKGILSSLDADGRVCVLLDVLGQEIVTRGLRLGLAPAA